MRATIEQTLLAQRGALIGWVPVCLGMGIGLYFLLPVEPDMGFLVTTGLFAVVAGVLSRMAGPAYTMLPVAILLVCTGIGLAKYRTDSIAAPVLDFRYYGPIEGRVVNIDRSASDAVRLTLDRVRLDRMRPDRIPARVRVSVHGTQAITDYFPGDLLIMTGHLSPPAGPAEPGGFDFQRHAWFLQIGAVGYTRTPVLRLAAADTDGVAMRIFAMRMAISAAVQQAMPGAPGAFAAAITTGDRSAIGQDAMADLRASNLAHLLAISGLHMGLLTGFIFSVVRYGLALIPTVALRWPIKKIAAVCALVVGAFYLALSGGNVATERAFIMVSVMFVALLLDRRALTLRAVAMAAIIVLAWQPEAMLGPGFQMSFAATTALVVAFGALRNLDLSRLPKWTRPVLSLFLSSLIAGFATAPFAAAHFNQIPHYGLIANLLSVPLMGMVVMPAAVLAACLAPLGLSFVAFWIMEPGLRWILWVAQSVSTLDGALSHIHAPQPAVLPVLTLGLLLLILWRGHLRYSGFAVVAFSALLWHQTERPAMLVADNGSLVGLLGEGGRALSSATGSGFIAGIWLENDGAPVPQDIAASRAGFETEGRVTTATLGTWQIVQMSGKTALGQISDCGGADILISNQTDAGERPCLVFDVARLRQTGSLALYLLEDGKLRITTASAISGRRPWNTTESTSGLRFLLEKPAPLRVAKARQ